MNEEEAGTLERRASSPEELPFDGPGVSDIEAPAPASDRGRPRNSALPRVLAMRRWLLGRLLMIPLSIAVIITVAFAIVNLSPGDTARAIAGPMADQDTIDAIESDLGLDLPVHERYAQYVSDLARGDLGSSYFTGRSVALELLIRIPRTVELVGLSLIFAIAVGLLVGGIGAYFGGRVIRPTVRIAISATQSVPDFFLGLVLIYFFFFLLGWAPSPVGRLSITGTPPPTVTGLLLVDALLAGETAVFWSAVRHSALPVITLATVYSAYFAKTARSVLSQELSSSYVEFARACGLRERSVLRYALLVGRTQFLTYGAILFGALIGGVAIIETVFSWQGAGQWALEGILNLDVPIVQGFILVAGLITLFTYLLLDFIVALLDPRVTYD